MNVVNKLRNTLLLIIWVYIDIDWHKMTLAADPNEEKFHFWVFTSRPKRIWEKFKYVNGEECIRTDNYIFFELKKWGVNEFEMEKYKLEQILFYATINVFIRKEVLNATD